MSMDCWHRYKNLETSCLFSGNLLLKIMWDLQGRGDFESAQKHSKGNFGVLQVAWQMHQLMLSRSWPFFIFNVKLKAILSTTLKVRNQYCSPR